MYLIMVHKKILIIKKINWYKINIIFILYIMSIDIKDVDLNKSVNTIKRIVKHNLKVLTRNLCWTIVNTIDCVQLFDDDADDDIRDLTEKEWDAYVLYGEEKIYLGDELDGSIKYITVGNKFKLTTLKTLLKAMEKEYQKKATDDEIEDIKNRYIRKNEFAIDFKDKDITFADWLAPHVYFEGPMYKSKNEPNKNMYEFFCGS